ncbi:MAG: intermembrane transport protein PqiB, partial [Janthinobacterium lividum]
MTSDGQGDRASPGAGPVGEANPPFSGAAGRQDARVPGQPGTDAARQGPQAQIRRRRFSLVWLIPLVAVGIAIYLGVQALNNRGPLITITFKTADGLTGGQTQVRHKAVALGTVEDIALSHDLSAVDVRVRLNAQGARIVTDRTRFWVVRPRFSSGNISGLETLVSGAFIAVDPGEPGGKPRTSFTGLEQPPGIQSDQPGRTYTLQAGSLGSLNEGTPVYYRDIPVGEVLGYDIGDGHGPVKVSIFVRDPFDKFVHPETRFWNASGLNVGLGPSGLHVEVQSLQAIISGAVTYDTPQEAWTTPPAADNTRFP